MTLIERLYNQHKIPFGESMLLNRLITERKQDIRIAVEAFRLYEYYIGTSLEYWFMVSELTINKKFTLQFARRIIRIKTEYELNDEDTEQIIEGFDRFSFTNIEERQLIDIYEFKKDNKCDWKEAYRLYNEVLNDYIKEQTRINEMFNDNE
ncbi:MAG: hypothetical protein Q8J85_07195 [Sulfuricurvum sp.]|nr:hypothetical protein [Sulfuricurvum sp.]MDP3022988.1 hypothetical protein [Sulfuricurvum sp.]